MRKSEKKVEVFGLAERPGLARILKNEKPWLCNSAKIVAVRAFVK